jgi:Flp pilus assembly pilin Flp
MRIDRILERLVSSDEGQDLLEYSMLVGLIAVVALGAVAAMANQINNVLWQTVVNNF